MSDSEDMNANLLDQAALFAVGALAEPEASAFQKTLATSKELQRVVSEYERTAASLADLAPREEPPASLKDRVMAAVDSDLDAQPWKNWKASPTDPLFFVAAGDDWEPSQFEGIDTRRLFVDKEQDRVTMTVRMAPGTSYPAHRHAGIEECFVLSGDLWVDDVHMHAGDYQRAESGSHHPVQRTDEGCVLLLVSSLSDEFE